MQVILGAGGAIGKDLARNLKNYTDQVRLFGRNPHKINDDDELFSGNLLDADAVDKAVAGAEVVYLTAGLNYRIDDWRKQWPGIMKNVVSACKKHNAKLVFFGNIYLYGKDQLNPMTEESEINPPSKKGKVREQIADMLMKEVQSGKLTALIARAADFYGPGIKNSMFYEMVIKNLKTGKKALWFCSTGYKHNFTYTPDAAKATALLGNTADAYGQVWHLPTAEAMTMKEWIEAFAKEIGTEPKSMVIPAFVIKIMGIFNPLMKEMPEMLYQYNRDYDFDSSKFETVFSQKPTPVEEAVKQVLQSG